MVFAPTTTYELAWETTPLPSEKPSWATAYEFATGQRLGSSDFEGGKNRRRTGARPAGIHRPGEATTNEVRSFRSRRQTSARGRGRHAARTRRRTARRRARIARTASSPELKPVFGRRESQQRVGVRFARQSRPRPPRLPPARRLRSIDAIPFRTVTRIAPNSSSAASWPLTSRLRQSPRARSPEKPRMAGNAGW